MKRYAILIANTIFPDYPALKELKTPLADIRGLGEALENPSRGAYTPAYYVPNESRDVVYKYIENTLVGERPEEGAGPDDFVLIYYSGHGLLDTTGRLHLATKGIRPNLNGALPFSWIMEAIAKSLCRKILVVLDCCYSGAAGTVFEGKGPPEEGQSVDAVARAAELAPWESTESRGLTPTSPNADARSAADLGVYLLTACSSLQMARGNLADGYGVFTKHFIDALKGSGAASNDPLDRKRSLITVGNIYRFVNQRMTATGEPPQTPMMWARNVAGGDLVVAPITFWGSRQPGPDRTQRWKLMRTKLGMDHLGPAYLLDDTFKFLDWNPAFDLLVATPLSLRRGDHVLDFIDHLDNQPRVKDESLDKFVPPHPPVHLEDLIFPAHKFGGEFGELTFQKIATQVRDTNGKTIAWCVNLNVTTAGDMRGLWRGVRKVMKRAAMWSRYATSYDEVVGRFSKYIELRDKLCEMLGTASVCLDLGAGTGNCTIRLLESKSDRTVTAIEGNETMLSVLDRKLGANATLKPRALLIKGEILSCLKEEEDNQYDGCVMMNVLFAVDNPVATLKELARVLTPGATLALSTSHEHTDIERLLGEIAFELPPDDLALQMHWQEALDRNLEMRPLITRYSKADVLRFVTEAGFSVFESTDDDYLGNVVTIKALKPIGQGS